MMCQMETSKFDEEHYLSDYFYGKEDYIYTEFINILIAEIDVVMEIIIYCMFLHSTFPS